jgi:transcriptional regulator with PAS, ATPase and Fis domain
MVYEATIESEKLYQKFTEYFVETVVIHVDHKVLHINQSGANFLRATKEDFIGACVLDIFQEDSKEMIVERIRGVCQVLNQLNLSSK